MLTQRIFRGGGVAFGTRDGRVKQVSSIYFDKVVGPDYSAPPPYVREMPGIRKETSFTGNSMLPDTMLFMFRFTASRHDSSHQRVVCRLEE